MDDIAIKVDHVSKDFVLPHEKITTLKSAFTHFYKLRANRTRETQHALRGISIEIKKGEFFGIVGRNGSGKSTLLKILAGIYQPTKGSIMVNGKLVPFIELGVGFNAELTGKENVYLNGAMLGFSRQEVDAMYDDIVAFAELERFMDQKLKNYSSGMQVRLAFSMATRSEADILLVDEVLAVGDTDFQRKCFDYFRKLKKDKKTVVFVTHDMNAVREYCNRAILIDKNVVVCRGTASAVASAYTRMFSEENKNSKSDDMSSRRWGDQAVKYESIKISSKKLTDADTTLTITVVAKANQHVDNPIFGFLIKNTSGVNILGTNSKLLQRTVETMQADEMITLTWNIPNIFSDGEYLIDPAIVHHDGAVVCDWWEDAKNFTVFKDQRTPYVVSPDIKVSISKK